jgi:hypothetical protein
VTLEIPVVWAMIRLNVMIRVNVIAFQQQRTPEYGFPQICWERVDVAVTHDSWHFTA